MEIFILNGSLGQFSSAYTIYRDHVVANGGAIYSAAITNAILDQIAALPGIVQWLDTRTGVAASTNNRIWFSLTGAATDATSTIYSNATFGVDTDFNVPVWSGGAFNGGHTPRLELGDSYTWGMYYYLPPNAGGHLWGERTNALPGGQQSAWTLANYEYWQSYYQGANEAAFYTLPRSEKKWLWVVKDGPQVTGYDEQNNIVFQLTLSYPIDEISMGIAGGTDSGGVMPAGFKYRTFIRLAFAASASQRAAIMSI